MSTSNGNTTNISNGIGFGGLLCIVFITLKLCGVINWSWLWVLSPLWIPIAITLVFVLVGIVIIILSSMISKLGD